MEEVNYFYEDDVRVIDYVQTFTFRAGKYEFSVEEYRGEDYPECTDIVLCCYGKTEFGIQMVGWLEFRELNRRGFPFCDIDDMEFVKIAKIRRECDEKQNYDDAKKFITGLGVLNG